MYYFWKGFYRKTQIKHLAPIKRRVLCVYTFLQINAGLKQLHCISNAKRIKRPVPNISRLSLVIEANKSLGYQLVFYGTVRCEWQWEKMGICSASFIFHEWIHKTQKSVILSKKTHSWIISECSDNQQSSKAGALTYEDDGSLLAAELMLKDSNINFKLMRNYRSLEFRKPKKNWKWAEIVLYTPLL